jgi:hypothetical protein
VILLFQLETKASTKKGRKEEREVNEAERVFVEGKQFCVTKKAGNKKGI